LHPAEPFSNVCGLRSFARADSASAFFFVALGVDVLARQGIPTTLQNDSGCLPTLLAEIRGAIEAAQSLFRTA